MDNELVEWAERLYPVAKAFEMLTGRRPSAASVQRWLTKGVKGIRLTAPLYLGKRMCSLPAAKAFLDSTSNAADGDRPFAVQPRTNRSANAAISAAEAALDRAGA